MDLKTRLISVPPRDLSGANASDRFAYQRTWALCHVMELHASGEDYVVIFDHHEDVSVLDAEDAPNSIKGYQIKTKDSGNFTLQAMLKREAGTGEPPTSLPSILGRLYDLKIRFPEDTKLLAVVSNASFSLRLSSDGKKHTDLQSAKFAELHQNDQDLINDALKSEHGIAGSPALNGILEFVRSDIPLRGHDTHAKGKLAEFLQQLFPDRKFSIIPLYRALDSEVEVRNNSHDQNLSFEDLVRRKALSRRRFSEVLQQAGASPVRVELQEVVQRLNSEGCPFAAVADLRREWDGAQLDHLEKRDIPHLRLREAVIAALASRAEQSRLTDLMTACYEEVAPTLRGEWSFTPTYVKVFIVLEAYERHQLVTASPTTQAGRQE